eukprot:gene2387-2691_t
MPEQLLQLDVDSNIAAACQSAFQQGFSLVLRDVAKRSRAVASLVDWLELGLGLPAGANLYFTPPGAQGLKAHYDDHCVFVFQLSGEKQWVLGPPQHHQLPFTYEPRLPVTLPQGLSGHSSGSRADQPSSSGCTTSASMSSSEWFAQHLDRAMVERPADSTAAAARDDGGGSRAQAAAVAQLATAQAALLAAAASPVDQQQEVCRDLAGLLLSGGVNKFNCSGSTVENDACCLFAALAIAREAAGAGGDHNVQLLSLVLQQGVKALPSV